MRNLKIIKSITNRDGVTIDRYLSEIAREELITAEEEVELAQRIRKGDDAAFTKLTSANLRFVVSVAKQYQNQGLTLPDLINEGNLGLMKAARRFDETRGFKFISYAVWWIRQSIMQAVAEHSRIIRLPLNKISALNKIKKAQAVLEQKLERQPSNEEVAAITTISEKETNAVIIASVRHMSTDSFINDESLRLGEILIDSSAVLPDGELMLESRTNDINEVLNKLTTQESDIIRMYFGVGIKASATLDEIAQKYDLTKERVRQIKERALRKLRLLTKNNRLRTHLG